MLNKLIASTIGGIQALLIVLRFINVLDWSWWLVFSPILITACGLLVYQIFKIIFCFWFIKI